MPLLRVSYRFMCPPSPNGLLYRNEHENTRHAAVLVLLYEKDGNLRVLLTTRAKTMRTHPGQTALPGGAKDDTDTDIVYTAVCYEILICNGDIEQITVP